MFHFRIISCQDLPVKDANGSIDSYVVIETKGKDNKPRPGGKTKVVQNNLNPVYPDKIFDISSEDCYTVKFTVMDEDPFKDDMACWIKIKVPSLMTKLGDKITKEMLIKNPEKHPNCHPTITFMVTLDGELAHDHPAKKIAPPPAPPAPKAEKITVEPIPDHNKYVFNILVISPEHGKYYFSEDANIPSFITKDGDRYTIDPEGQGNLIMVPIYRTTRSFKKTTLQVKCNDLVLKEDLKYRGEWLLHQALNCQTKEVRQFKPLHRNNHSTQRWIELLPAELVPKVEYTRY